MATKLLLIVFEGSTVTNEDEMTCNEFLKLDQIISKLLVHFKVRSVTVAAQIGNAFHVIFIYCMMNEMRCVSKSLPNIDFALAL